MKVLGTEKEITTQVTANTLIKQKSTLVQGWKNSSGFKEDINTFTHTFYAAGTNVQILVQSLLAKNGALWRTCGNPDYALGPGVSVHSGKPDFLKNADYHGLISFTYINGDHC